jgi:hypothetical protein
MTNTEIIGFNLPPGAILRGRLYRDPNHRYGSGYVMDVAFPWGTSIELSWDQVDSYEMGRYEYRLQAYSENFDAKPIDCQVPDPETAAALIQILIDHYARSVAQST